MEYFSRIGTGFALWVIGLISIPVWLVRGVLRSPSSKRLVLWFTALSISLILLLGFPTYIQILMTGGQLAMGFVFMMLQFVGLFWFLSKTKEIEMHPGDTGSITFDDYYGSQHLVSLVKEWTYLLTHPEELWDIGAEAISGLLLIGAPGTGKTMLAQALSSDSGAAFLGLTGSDFSSMFFGIGVIKVRGMFGKARRLAREYGACILFIDEVDSIAANRGGVQGGGNDGPVRGGMAGMMGGMGGLGVMSRLLTEMDGLRDESARDMIQNWMRAKMSLPLINPGVVLVMGATNRPDVLDPAILRPGRFDRKIQVDLPDSVSRRALFVGYLGKVKHDDTINVDTLVADSHGVSPAFLASAIQKDAPRIAIFDGRNLVAQSDIESAIQENIVGMANPIGDFDPKQKRQVAVHEAGHAVAAYHYRPHKRIARASIIRRGGGILGYMMDVDTVDVYAMPLRHLALDIGVGVAGHLATEVVLGELWTGATSDVRNIQGRVAALAMHGVFAERIPLDPTNPYQDKEILEEANRFLADVVTRTKRLMEWDRLAVEGVADALVEKGELTGEEVVAIIERDGHGRMEEVYQLVD